MNTYLVADFSTPDTEDKGMAEFLKNPENDTFGREPVLAVMPDGSLVCTFLTGGKGEPHNRNVVLYKKSYDGGKSWTDARILFAHSFQGLWVTEIFTGFEKPMMVITMYNADYPAKALQNFVSYTNDCGESWSYPVSIDPMMQAVSVRAGIRMSNNEVLFPLYYQVSHKCFDWDIIQYYKPHWWDGVHSESSVAITSDEGKNYSRFGKIKLGEVSLWEPSCVEAEDGHILMFLRSDKGYLGLCESFDFGRTWSDFTLTDMPHPGTKISTFKIGSKLGLATNFNSKERKNLALYISEDNGRHWNKAFDLDDPDAFFCYPHFAIDQNKRIVYIMYENFKQHYIKVVPFEELGL